MGLEQYRILDIIGEGVSAKVYKALDSATGSLVALKILSPHLQADDVSIERFKREVQITRLIGHPQIVSVYDLVRDGEQTCLVMEYLEGKNLKDFIAANHPLPIDTVVAILRQALDILCVCHGKGIIHRDLKPQNIIVEAGATIRLVDFGIAKMTTLSDLTHTGTSIGSPEYMAPELFATNTFDPRTDIYALGIIGFEMLTGAPPFRGDSLAVLYNQHLNTPVPSLAEARNGLPPWLQYVIERMLAKRAYERYQSADEALADVQQRRVLAREIPQVKKKECLQCGQQTLSELPVCLYCGSNSQEAIKSGDYNVLCNRDEDDAKIEGFLQSVFALSQPLRRQRRTLLFTGLDHFGAELIKRSANEHRLALTVEPHSPFSEFRKATALAIVCFVLSWLGAFVGARYAYYGRAMVTSFQGLSLLHVPVLGFWLALVWIGVERFQRIEVEPLFSVRDVVHRNLTRDYEWLRRLVPLLTPERSESCKVLVAQLAEKYLKLVRFARNVDAATAQALETLVENGARLAAVVSEIETALQATAFAERLQRYAFLESQVRADEDPTQRAALTERRQRLREEVASYLAVEEKYGALLNKLVALQALFNRLLGRLLVFHAPIDRAGQDLLISHIRQLKEDLTVSREVQAELARLG
ncbi:MAG: protein kinase [Candidatus Binatia bacterium]